MAGYNIHSWVLDILEGDSINVLKILIVNFRKLFSQAQGDPVGVPGTGRCRHVDSESKGDYDILMCLVRVYDSFLYL